MKNIKKINVLGLMAIFLTLFSCTSEPAIQSKITYYPVFDYEPTVIVAVGESFTPHADASENGVPLEVTVNGSVDKDVVGVYNVSYTATNSDGFAGTVNQIVIVHNPAIVGTDVSGEIVDANNATRKGTISLVDGTTSIFYASDFGFAGVFPVYFQMNGDVISEIKQDYINGVSSVVLGYDPATLRFTTRILPQGFAYTFKYQ